MFYVRERWIKSLRYGMWLWLVVLATPVLGLVLDKYLPYGPVMKFLKPSAWALAALLAGLMVGVSYAMCARGWNRLVLPGGIALGALLLSYRTVSLAYHDLVARELGSYTGLAARGELMPPEPLGQWVIIDASARLLFLGAFHICYARLMGRIPDKRSASVAVGAAACAGGLFIIEVLLERMPREALALALLGAVAGVWLLSGVSVVLGVRAVARVLRQKATIGALNRGY